VGSGVNHAGLKSSDERFKVYYVVSSAVKFYFFSSPGSLFPNPEGANVRHTWDQSKDLA
jgi:hypothetical protein